MGDGPLQETSPIARAMATKTRKDMERREARNMGKVLLISGISDQKCCDCGEEAEVIIQSQKPTGRSQTTWCQECLVALVVDGF
jgi:hypothetical protein